MWRPDLIADAAAAALERHACELELAQSVRGLDALAELAFHPLLAAGFRDTGWQVLSEWPYPGEVSRRPRHAERERCDLVLTDAGLTLTDPVAALRERDTIEGTLFAAAADLAAPAPQTCPPEDAFWLEVKLAAQFCFTSGVPGPNRTYSSDLLRLPAADIAKLARESAIRHGGVLIILFTADRPTADHDLGVLMHRLIDRAHPVQSPSLARFAITDRIGNSLCTIALIPVRGEETRGKPGGRPRRKAEDET